MQKGGSSKGGPFAVLGRIVRAEGVRGLWVGTTPSMVRTTHVAVGLSPQGGSSREHGVAWHVELRACVTPCLALHAALFTCSACHPHAGARGAAHSGAVRHV